jgi:hypothetical protein
VCIVWRLVGFCSGCCPVVASLSQYNAYIWNSHSLDDTASFQSYACEADVCSQGKYSVGGIGPSSCSGVCSSPAGSYCGLGMTSAAGALCPAGTYGAVAGLTSAECSGQCPVGQWSSAGATSCSPCASAVGPGATTCGTVGSVVTSVALSQALLCLDLRARVF